MSHSKNTGHHGEFFMIGAHCDRGQFDQIIRSRNAVWVDESACNMDFMQIFVYAAEEGALKSRVVWDQWKIDGETVMRNDDPHQIDHEKVRVFFSPLTDSQVNSLFSLRGPVIFKIDGPFKSSFHIDHLICSPSKNEISVPSIQTLESLDGSLKNLTSSIKTSIKHLFLHPETPINKTEMIETSLSGFENLVSIRALHRPICLGILPHLKSIKAGRVSLTPLVKLDLYVPELELIDCDTITISDNDRSYGTINSDDFPVLKEIRFRRIECTDQGEIALFRQVFNMRTRLVRKTPYSY